MILNLMLTLVLQNDIDVLQQWTEIWLLKPNEEKCKYMSIGMAAHQNYCIGLGSNRKARRTVEEERDLRICKTSDTKWKHQCYSAAAKATQILGMIKRMFNFMEKDICLILYSTYVRPHLEFCMQAWAPFYQMDSTDMVL